MSTEKKDNKVPDDKFEHDLNLPEDAEDRYSPEFKADMQAMIDRLKKPEPK